MRHATVEGALVLGIAIGGGIGYVVGRSQQAMKYWRHSYHKLKRDRRDVWRGPRW